MRSAASLRSPPAQSAAMGTGTASTIATGNYYPLWSCASVRLAIAIALALSLAIEGLMRSNINMAMVCMINKTAISVNQNQGKNETIIPNQQKHGLLMPAECAHQIPMMEIMRQNMTKISKQSGNISAHDGSSSDEYAGGDLLITKQEQSLIFTSFYLGGLLIILPCTYLSNWLGPTQLVFYGALVNVIGTFVTPFVVRNFGPIPLAIVRFLMGCGHGILIPCVSVIVAHWFPLAEKSTAIAIYTTGNQISVIVAMFLTAELCVLTWLGGWASAFYIYGIIGVVFCAIWLVLVTDNPSGSKRISREELTLIQATSHGDCSPLADEKNSQNINKDVPWRNILSSMVVWSMGMSSFSQNFMNVGIVVYLPTYYQNVLGMDLTANGLMSALPFVIQLITKIWFAGMADWIKGRKLMSPTAVTKMFNLIGSLGAGICFILLSFCDCSTPHLAIGLAVSAVGISSGFIPGYNTSVVCIAPRYTSSIASFSRLLGQFASVASPYMIGLIVVKGTKAEWQLAFWVMSAILIFTGILFQLFGSASVQDWATTAPRTPLALSHTRAPVHEHPEVDERQREQLLSSRENVDQPQQMGFFAD